MAGRVLEREENRRPTRLDGGRLKGSEGPSDAGYVKPVDGTEENPFNKVHYRLRKINAALMKEILLLKCCKGPRRIFCAGAPINISKAQSSSIR